ncbi:unnamed protein product [Prunus brigantina]
MDMKGSNIGVVAMMFMMVGVVMGQSVDPNFFDDSFSDVTPFKNSPPPVKKMPPSHQIPSPLAPVRKSPPKSHFPPIDNSCLRSCQVNCVKFNDNKMFWRRRVCLNACPSKCKIKEGSKYLKNCLIDCIKNIPTLSDPAFGMYIHSIPPVFAEKSIKGQLDFCYHRCSPRIKINN